MNDATAQDCLSISAGRLVISTPWHRRAAGQILVNGKVVDAAWAEDADGSSAAAHGPWQVTAKTEPLQGIRLQIANTTQTPQHLDSVTFARWAPDAFAPALQTAEFRELVHGGSFLEPNAGVKCVGRKTAFLDFIPASSMLTVYQCEQGGALLLGVLPPVGEALSEFRTVHAEAHFEGTFGFEVRHVFDCVLHPGESACTSPLIALCGGNGTDLMSAYGKRWAGLLENRPPRSPMVGWNSWDYYSGAVTREAMDTSLDTAGELFGDALHVFAIDEGWERQWGSWEANHKFPEGLADFCRHVKAHGRIPGVWTAPLLVNTYNPLFLEHPDWFASRADGQLQTDSYSYGPMAYLDVTKPDVIKHLQGVFSRLRGAGFEYFKVDFCQCILKAARFSDRRVGRNGLVRRAFQAIREAIGADAYLLSCGAPYESVVGLADAVRSTGDIHIYWGHILRNAGPLSVRWWMQGNLWNCDPDFLVVRGPDTAAPPFARRGVVTPLGPGGGWVAGREFNADEARVYALLVHLSGGDVILGDRLATLNTAGLALVRRVLKPRVPAAVPVDLFETEQDLPRVWVSHGKRDTVVGLFNWSDRTARTDFDPENHGLTGPATDFWTGEDIEAVPTRMRRRSCSALVYRRQLPT